MKKKKIILFVVLAVVLGVVIGVTAIKENIEKQLSGVTVSEVDLTLIADGTYRGSCSVFPVSVEVDVTVKDYAIIGIELIEHQHGQGAAAEVIPDRVVETQSLLVDTISGATYSSNAILKAIENALTGIQ